MWVEMHGRQNVRRTRFLFALVGIWFLALSCAHRPGRESVAREVRCDVPSFVPEVARGGVTELMVPMRDCVQLATDVYVPDGEHPLPVILIRLPYGRKTGVEDLPAMRLAGFLLAASGYAVVIQDTRGRYGSEGTFVPFLYEQQDGIDTVAWITAQPWCDGTIGMFGGSYFGFTQLAIAAQRPPSLKALIPLVTPSSVYSLLYHRGLPRADLFVNWALDMYREGSMEGGRFWQAALHWPFREADDFTVGNVPWFDEWLDHPFIDAFYDALLPLDVIDRFDIPMFMLSGWFDLFTENQLADFSSAQRREKVPGTNRIIVGPWTHSMGFDEHHDMVFPNAGSLLSFFDLMVEWFDHFLKGMPLRSWGPVRMYDPGRGIWFDRSTLWSPDRTPYVLYLSGDAGAVSCAAIGRLEPTPMDLERTITYIYDPLRPLVVFGGPLLDMPSGCILQELHCDRTDVITFESAPFIAPVRIDGTVVLELTVGSSAPDTVFVGRISLVRPDGRAYFLRQGVTTLSHRTGDTEQATYHPRDVVDVQIDMPPLVWTINAGERLRLEVMSSSVPSIVQHPNVDKDWFSVRVPKSAEQAVYLGPGRTSRLVLEVSPSEDVALEHYVSTGEME